MPSRGKREGIFILNRFVLKTGFSHQPSMRPVSQSRKA
jgi:hypothetical protein